MVETEKLVTKRIKQNSWETTYTIKTSRMQINEAVILAGGLGTRLRAEVPNLPKAMAPVNGTPFLKYVIDHFEKQGIEKFIFALGFESEIIEAYLQRDFPRLKYQLSIETEPLGTGGAIKKALELVKERSALVTNGDTLFKVNLKEIAAFHTLSGANCTLSLKPMQNFDRYGMVEINEESRITAFKEKKYYEKGCINGGVYLVHAAKFLEEDLPQKFSFEKEYLEALYEKKRMYGIIQDAYFIDIGIPEDYQRAQLELK